MSFLEKIKVKLELDTKDFDNLLIKSQRRIDLYGKSITILSRSISTKFVGALSKATRELADFSEEMVVVGSQFEQAVTTLSAISGADEGALDRYAEEARRLGAATAFTATQAAEGMQELARAGLDTTTILASIGGALEFAGANAITLKKSTSFLSATMKQFSINASGVNEILDTFTTVSQNSLFDIESLSVAMRYGGAVASNLGMSLQETTAVMASFRDLGLEGSMVGTRFRQAILSLAAPTKTAKAFLKQYGLEVEDVDIKTKGLTEVLRTLGKAGLDSAEKLVPLVSKRAAGSVSELTQRLKRTVALDDIRKGAEELGYSFDELDSTKLSNLEDYFKDLAKNEAIKQLGSQLDGLSEEAAKKKIELFIEAKGIPDTIDKIDKLQIKFANNAGVTARTYEKMISTVEGQYKILVSAIQEFQISTFEALNSQTKFFDNIEGRDTEDNIFYGFSDALKEAKEVFDSFALAVQTDTAHISAIFSSFREQLVGLFPVEDTHEFTASVVVAVENVAKLTRRLMDLLPILIQIGKMATLITIGAIFRRAAFHVSHSVQQITTAFGAFVAYGANAVIPALQRLETGLVRLSTKLSLAYSMPSAGKGISLINLFTGAVTKLGNTLEAVLMPAFNRLNSTLTVSANLFSRFMTAVITSKSPLDLLRISFAQVQTTISRLNFNPIVMMRRSVDLLRTSVRGTINALNLLKGAVASAGKASSALTSALGGPIGAFLMLGPLAYDSGKTLYNMFSPAAKDANNKAVQLARSMREVSNANKEFQQSIIREFAGTQLKDYRDDVIALKEELKGRGELSDSLIKELNASRDLTDERRKELALKGQLLQIDIDGQQYLLSHKAIIDLANTSLGEQSNILAQRNALIQKAKDNAEAVSDENIRQLKSLNASLNYLELQKEKGSDITNEFKQRQTEANKLLALLGLETRQYSNTEEAITHIGIILDEINKKKAFSNSLIDAQTAAEEQNTKKFTDNARKKEEADKKVLKAREDVLKLEEKLLKEYYKQVAKTRQEEEGNALLERAKEIRKVYDEEIKFYKNNTKKKLELEERYRKSINILANTYQEEQSREMDNALKESQRRLQLMEANEIESVKKRRKFAVEDLEKEERKEINALNSRYKLLQDTEEDNYKLRLSRVRKNSQDEIDIELDYLDKKSKIKKEKEEESTKLKSVYAAKKNEIETKSGKDLIILQERIQKTIDDLYAQAYNLYDLPWKKLEADKQAEIAKLKLITDNQEKIREIEELYNTLIAQSRIKAVEEVTQKYGENTAEILKLERERLTKSVDYDKQISALEEQRDSAVTNRERKRLDQKIERLKFEKNREEELFDSRIDGTKRIFEIEKEYSVKRQALLAQQEDIQKRIDSAEPGISTKNLEQELVQIEKALKFLFFQKETDISVTLNKKKPDEFVEDLSGTLAGTEFFRMLTEGFRLADKYSSKLLVNVRDIFGFFTAMGRDSQQDPMGLAASMAHYNKFASFLVKTDKLFQEKIPERLNAAVVRYRFFTQIQLPKYTKDLGDSFDKAKTGLGDFFTSLKEDPKQAITSAFGKSGEGLVGLLGSAKDGLKGFAASAGKALGKIPLDKLMMAFEAFKKITDIGLQAINAMVDGVKRLYDSLVATFSYLSGGFDFNVFNVLSGSIDAFISKEEELIGRQKELQDQLARREISQAEFDEAISGGIGAVDPQKIANEYIDELVDKSIRFTNALVSQAPYVLERFAQRLPEIFNRVQSAIPQLVDTLISYMPSIFRTIVNGFMGMIPQLGNAIRSMLSTSGTQISQFIGNQLGNLGYILYTEFSKFVTMLLPKLPAIADNLISGAEKFIGYIIKAFDDLTSNADGLLPVVTKLVNTFYKLLYKGLRVFIVNSLTLFSASLPNIASVILTNITDLLNEVINLIVDLIDKTLPVFLTKITPLLEEVIAGIISLAVKLINAIIVAIPKLIPSIIRLAFILVEEIILLIPRLVEVLVSELYNGLIDIARQIGQTIKDSIVEAIPALGGLLGEERASLNLTEEQEKEKGKIAQFFDNLFNSSGSTTVESYGDTPGAIKAGTEGLLAKFKAGDYVIAAQQPTDLLNQALSSFMGEMKNLSVPSIPQPAMATNQSSQPIDIAIIAEGKLLDAVQVRAMDRGHAPKMERKLRRASGVKVGFERGRFNRF